MINDYFLLYKSARLLLYLYNNNKAYLSIARLAYLTNCSYAYTHRIIHFFHRDKLLTLDAMGRNQQIKLTEKGKKLAHHLAVISSLKNINLFK